MLKELWRDIPDYEGYYQVSNQGRVKNAKTGYILKNWIAGRRTSRPNNNYYAVELSKDGVKKTKYVHVLVALSFIDNEYLNNKLVCDHIDEDRFNNALSNLRLISNRVNCSRGHKKRTLSSKYTGVYFHNKRNKFVASIYFNGKNNHIGLFTDEYDAHIAYENFKKVNGIN